MNPELLSDPHPRMLLSAILAAAPGSVRQLVERMEPLSPPAREVLSAARSSPCPATWFEGADRKRIWQNMTLWGKILDLYREVIGRCTDEYQRAEMLLTLRTMCRELLKVRLGLVFQYLPFDTIRCSQKGANVANVGQSCVNVGVVGVEILEVLDETCVPLIEDQLSNGT
jgi:hypothetical protein